MAKQPNTSTPPSLRRDGIRAIVPPAPEASIFPRGSLRGAERPLLHQFIGLQRIPVAVRSIFYDGTTCAANRCLWFGLADWTPDEIGQETALVGYRTELGPTNNTTTDPAFPGAKLWGTASGEAAALVFGFDLPVTAGVWVDGPPVPFAAEVNAIAPNIFADRVPWQVHTFAQGALVDASPSIVYRTQQTTPLAELLTGNSRFSVAVAFRRQSLTALGGMGASVGFLPIRIQAEFILAGRLNQVGFTE